MCCVFSISILAQKPPQRDIKPPQRDIKPPQSDIKPPQRDIKIVALTTVMFYHACECSDLSFFNYTMYTKGR